MMTTKRSLDEIAAENARLEALTHFTTLAEQQKQIEALTDGLLKVSAQLEASNPAPQLVNNP
jgi:hypothetical protein